MKNKYMVLPAILLLAACSGKSDLNYPDRGKGPVSVVLPVAPLSGADGAASRAVVDSWDQTTVSLAYRRHQQAVYTENVDVVVKNNADQVIHMGMQYPLDGSRLYVRGYHPAASPDEAGIVRYDISRGDLDLMTTEEIYGNRDSLIIASDTNKLFFRHKLIRLTIKMACASDHTYSERITAVVISGNAGRQYISTQAELDLSDGSVSFRAPGTVMAGYNSDGFQIPPYGITPVVIEAMVRPGVPLKVQLLSADDGVIDVSLAGSSLAFLETDGGVEGRQYVISLSLRSASALADNVGIVGWGTGTMPYTPTGNNQWW